MTSHCMTLTVIAFVDQNFCRDVSECVRVCVFVCTSLGKSGGFPVLLSLNN